MDRYSCCACLQGESQSRCRRLLGKAASSDETNICRIHVSRELVCCRPKKTADTLTTIPSPNSQTCQPVIDSRTDREPERKVACASASCETVSSIPRTYRKTIDGSRPAESAACDRRLRYSQGRKRAANCNWRYESSLRRKSSGTTSKNASIVRDSFDA